MTFSAGYPLHHRHGVEQGDNQASIEKIVESLRPHRVGCEGDTLGAELNGGSHERASAGNLFKTSGPLAAAMHVGARRSERERKNATATRLTLGQLPHRRATVNSSSDSEAADVKARLLVCSFIDLVALSVWSLIGRSHDGRQGHSWRF